MANSRRSQLAPRTALSYGDALQVLALISAGALPMCRRIPFRRSIAARLPQVTRGTLLIQTTVLRGVTRYVSRGVCAANVAACAGGAWDGVQHG